MTDAETIADLREKLNTSNDAYNVLLARIGEAIQKAEGAVAAARTAAEAAEQAQKDIAGILGGILEGRPAVARCPRCHRPMEVGHFLCDLCELKETLLNRPSPWNPGPSQWGPLEVPPPTYHPDAGLARLPVSGGLFPSGAGDVKRSLSYTSESTRKAMGDAIRRSSDNTGDIHE